MKTTFYQSFCPELQILVEMTPTHGSIGQNLALINETDTWAENLGKIRIFHALGRP